MSFGFISPSLNAEYMTFHSCTLLDKHGDCLMQGFVISDSEALDRLSHPYGSNYRKCVLSAINAGVDMVDIKP